MTKKNKTFRINGVIKINQRDRKHIILKNKIKISHAYFSFVLLASYIDRKVFYEQKRLFFSV